MKKAFSILLISVLIFSVAGYEIIFSVMLYQYKEAGESIISSSKKTEDEVVLVINSSNKNLFERENDHEVKFKGIMYDIRKEEKKGNDLILHAVMDVNEQNFVNIFRIENKPGATDKNSKARINNKDFNRIYLISLIAQKYPEQKISEIIIPAIAEYNQPDKQLDTPPPQIFAVS